MATLTTEQMEIIRTEIGDDPPPEDFELQEIYDRRGFVYSTIIEVVKKRLAALRREAAQFTVPGEYSQNTAENIKALERQLAELYDLEAEEIAEAGGGSASDVEIVRLTRGGPDITKFSPYGRSRTRGR